MILDSNNLRAVNVHDTIDTMYIYWPFADDKSCENFDLYYYTDNDFNPEDTQIDSIPWYEWSDAEILRQTLFDGHEYKKRFTLHDEGTYWPCSVLIQEDVAGQFYTVRIH
jgi:hypothetical protein